MYSGLGSEKASLMRRQQIDTLKLFNKVTEVTEGKEYKVEFYADSVLFNILVCLSPDFPLEKPVLKVDPIVSHPWVNSSTGEIVSAPGLLKFTIHSELGRVVQAIIREFELRPPPLADGQPKDYRTSDNSNEISSCIGSSNGDFTLVSNLNTLTISQLEKLNNEGSSLEEFINDLPVMSDLGKNLEDEITNIEMIANENMSHEEDLLSLKSEVNKLTNDLSEAYKRYQMHSEEYSKLCEKYQPQSIRENLVSSISQVDEESEKIAEKFLKGEIDLDTFLTDYSSHRFLSHSRKFKAENLGHQLNKLHQAGY